MFKTFLVNVRRNELIKPYFSLNSKSLYHAFEDLSKDAFRVYIYLADHRKDAQICVSKATAMAELNISEESFDKGIEELSEKRYFIKFNDYYDFYEVPLTESEANYLIEKRNKPINLLDLGLYL